MNITFEKTVWLSKTPPNGYFIAPNLLAHRIDNDRVILALIVTTPKGSYSSDTIVLDQISLNKINKILDEPKHGNDTT